MPTHETFTCPPIRSFVMQYLKNSKVSVDPFARNFPGCTYTNDLNPNTQAQYHMDARSFLEMLVKQGVRADLVVFDPPYSPQQIKEHYRIAGVKFSQEDAQRSHAWTAEKNLINQILPLNGHVLCFDWNTMGMGKNRGYSIKQILIVCHGAGHNDTLCMAERRTSEQMGLFPFNKRIETDEKDVHRSS